MDKYAPLAQYLELNRASSLTLSFEQVEDILGSELPDSARRSPSFWANDLQHSQARDWIGAGWVSCDVSVPQQKVTFTRGGKSQEKLRQLLNHELFSYVFRSRHAALEKAREIAASPSDSAARVDQRLYGAMVLALPPNSIVDGEIYPPPSRGRRTQPGVGSITVRSQQNFSVPIRATIASMRMEADVTLPGGLGDPSRWPSSRETHATTFLLMWESQDPWLVVRRDSSAGPDAPLHLHATLSFRRVPSLAECRRVWGWLSYEADALEDGLRKILHRKTPVAALRAARLSAKRLDRHVRPPERIVRSHAVSENPILVRLVEVFGPIRDD